MPSFDYARMASVARRLLTQFGQQVTVTREVKGGYDPETGMTTPDTTQSYSVNGAALNYRHQDVDGTLIQRGDVRVLLSPGAAFEPQPGDKVALADGTVLTVISARPTKPAGMAVLFEVQCRG